MYENLEKLLLINVNNKNISSLDVFPMYTINKDNYHDFSQKMIEKYYFAFIICDIDDSVKMINQIIDTCTKSGVVTIPIVIVNDFESDMALAFKKSPIFIRRLQLVDNKLIISKVIKILSRGLLGHKNCVKNNDICVDEIDLLTVLGFKGAIYFYSTVQNGSNALTRAITSFREFFHDNITGIYINMEINSEYPILNIYEELNPLYDMLTNTSNLIFSTNTNNHRKDDSLEVEFFATGV